MMLLNCWLGSDTMKGMGAAAPFTSPNLDEKGSTTTYHTQEGRVCQLMQLRLYGKL